MNQLSVHNWITDLKDLKQFLSVVVLSAPDDFPREDYLKDDEQLSLDNSFEYIRKSFSVIPEICNTPDVKSQFEDIVSRSYHEYKSGDVFKGAKLLQELRTEIESRLKA